MADSCCAPCCVIPSDDSSSREEKDGRVRIKNLNIRGQKGDTLYHLGLGTETHDLVEMFGDVKFVCLGGTAARMEKFAYFILKEIGMVLSTGTALLDISSKGKGRYSIYKSGPVLSVSCGMGIPSISVVLHELIKLLYYAKVKDPVFFKIGTCGGVAVEPGTVIISDDPVDSMLRNCFTVPVLGQITERPAKLDRKVMAELQTLTELKDPFVTVTGRTMCTSDYYEEQGRLDGAICEYTDMDKQKFFRKLQRNGVINIEMESIPFAALTFQAGIKAAVVCVVIVNRVKDDQVTLTDDQLKTFQERPQIIVARYIKKKLGKRYCECC